MELSRFASHLPVSKKQLNKNNLHQIKLVEGNTFMDKLQEHAFQYSPEKANFGAYSFLPLKSQ